MTPFKKLALLPLRVYNQHYLKVVETSNNRKKVAKRNSLKVENRISSQAVDSRKGNVDCRQDKRRSANVANQSAVLRVIEAVDSGSDTTRKHGVKGSLKIKYQRRRNTRKIGECRKLGCMTGTRAELVIIAASPACVMKLISVGCESDW